MDKHGITILYHLHQCRPCTSSEFHAKFGKGGIMFFLVNASPSKLLDVATSNFSHALVRSKSDIAMV